MDSLCTETPAPLASLGFGLCCCRSTLARSSSTDRANASQFVKSKGRGIFACQYESRGVQFFNKIVVQDHVQDQQWSEDLLFRRNCRFSRIIPVVLSGPGRGGRRIGKTQFAARVRVSVWVFPKPGSRFAGPQPITLAELCGLFSYGEFLALRCLPPPSPRIRLRPSTPKSKVRSMFAF